MTPEQEKARENDMCECGHIRKRHYMSRGTCEGAPGFVAVSRPGSFGFSVCTCPRFKKAK